MIGGWMSRVATGWLVFRLSESDPALMLGVIGFVGQAPAFLLSPFAGVMVDRWNRHRLLIATQSAFMIQSALLAAVAFFAEPGTQTLVLIGCLSAFEGLLNAFDMPARQAFLLEMVTRQEDQPNAIALNSSLVNGARLIGPTLAGVLIATAGEGWCFVADAASSIAIVGALLAMTIATRPPQQSSKPLWHDLKDGFRYAFGFAPIRSILLLLALVSFMGIPYSVLLPIFAVDVLHGGPYTLGFLTTAAGVGALTGALYLASRLTVLGLGRVIVLATSLFGVGLIVFGLSNVFWLSLLALLFAGCGMMVQMAACNTILQTIVDHDKRGRVMGFYSMAFLGMVPCGSLFAGLMAGWFGAPITVVIGGCACLAGAAWFGFRLPAIRALVRPIYAQRGISREVASGLQAAADLAKSPCD